MFNASAAGAAKISYGAILISAAFNCAYSITLPALLQSAVTLTSSRNRHSSYTVLSSTTDIVGLFCSCGTPLQIEACGPNVPGIAASNADAAVKPPISQ